MANDFVIENDTITGAVLQPGGIATATIRFLPSNVGPETATLSVVSNTGGVANTTQNVILNGNGVASAPTIDVTPAASLDFSDVPAGTQSAAQTVTVQNDGNANLIIGTISKSGANGAEFLITNDLVSSKTLTPTQSATFQVKFAPASLGARSATVNIPNNADTNHTLSLTGNGVSSAVPTASPSTPSLTFPQTLFGQTSTAQTVIITNTTGGGSAPLITGQASITGTNAASFNISADTFSNSTIQANNSGSVSITYTPQSGSEVASANLVLTDNSGGVNNAVQTISLSGTGKTPAPAVQLSTTTLNFPNTVTGVTSSALTVSVTNSGTANLVTTAATLAGTNPGDFSIFSDAVSNQTITPNSSAAIQIKFTPSVSGARSAVLRINDNATGSPQLVALNGTGVVAAPLVNLTPNPVSFGATNIGALSSTHTVTVTNAGTSSLIIGTVSLSGPFVIFTDNASGQTVAPGNNVTVVLKFSPTLVGSASGSIIVPSNASGSPHTAVLSGTGTVPSVQPLGHTIYSYFYLNYGLSSVEGFGGETYQGWQQTVPAPAGTAGTHTYAAPASIASDFYPGDYWSGAANFPATIYSSSSSQVLLAQCLQAISAGIRVLMVSWSPPPDRSNTLISNLLTAAQTATTQTGIPLYVSFMIEAYDTCSFTDPTDAASVTGGRSNANVWRAINYINGTYGSHPNFYRTGRVGWHYAANPSGVNIFFLNHPEYDYLVAGAPNTPITPGGTYWQTSTDKVHNPANVPVGGLILAESSFSSANCDTQHFDGGFVYLKTPVTQAGAFNVDVYQYNRTYQLGFPPTAICVPAVAPGHSAWRLQDAVYNKRLDRTGGGFYDNQWNQALNGVAMNDVIVSSWNHWGKGTQIEPATNDTTGAGD